MCQEAVLKIRTQTQKQPSGSLLTCSIFNVPSAYRHKLPQLSRLPPYRCALVLTACMSAPNMAAASHQVRVDIVLSQILVNTQQLRVRLDHAETELREARDFLREVLVCNAPCL